MENRTVIFYGFTNNKITETTICNDLREAHDLFVKAFNEDKYYYMDITLTNEKTFECKIVRKYAKGDY